MSIVWIITTKRHRREMEEINHRIATLWETLEQQHQDILLKLGGLDWMDGTILDKLDHIHAAVTLSHGKILAELMDDSRGR